ncbi:response regulator [Sediminibacillus sp. JSM 1682029]|uniref:response regulator transcription factor n=1 Tax=Sediminibacillus sp. JSM 1682029 TaxID=3229857 RepID=UPI0035249908
MTCKMLIVDDEPIIRNGLTKTIPWENYGIEIADTAHDGLDAMNKINAADDIDIVVTDVRMPNQDGLQLAAYLAEHYPAIRIIILSGYDDFNYAKQAMHAGVKDYLLKPVDIDELIAVVRNTTEEILEERFRTAQMENSAIRNELYYQVIERPVSHFPDKQLVGKVKLYPFVTLIKNHSVLTTEESRGQLGEWKRHWENRISQLFTSSDVNCISFFTGENMLLTSLIVKKEELKIDAVKRLLISGISEMEIPLYALLYDRYIRMNELADVYRQFEQSLSFLPLADQGILQLPLQDSWQKDCSLSDFPSDKLIDSILRGETDKVRDRTNELFDSFRYHACSLEDAISAARDVVSSAYERCQGLMRKQLDADPVLLRSLDFQDYNTYEAIQTLFENDVRKLMDQYQLTHAENNDWLMERAEAYMKNYYTTDIKAHEVADVVNISPNYFSSLFKQRTGRNFNEYVNELRVEQAKTLLASTPFKVREVAEQVGYHEYKYFVEVFKKFVGMTPTEYRKWNTAKVE